MHPVTPRRILPIRASNWSRGLVASEMSAPHHLTRPARAGAPRRAGATLLLVVTALLFAACSAPPRVQRRTSIAPLSSLCPPRGESTSPDKFQNREDARPAGRGDRACEQFRGLQGCVREGLICLADGAPGNASGDTDHFEIERGWRQKLDQTLPCGSWRRVFRRSRFCALTARTIEHENLGNAFDVWDGAEEIHRLCAMARGRR